MCVYFHIDGGLTTIVASDADQAGRTMLRNGGGTPGFESPGTYEDALSSILTDAQLQTLGNLQAVLCENTRCQIMRAVTRGYLNVTDICRLVQRPKTSVSQHLRVLRETGFVANRREGRNIFYRVTEEDSRTATLLDIINRTVEPTRR